MVFYKKLAEIVDKHLKKGAQIYIEGRIRTRKWQDRDGQDRYSTEIEADELKMLGGRPQDKKPGGDGDMPPTPPVEQYDADAPV